MSDLGSELSVARTSVVYLTLDTDLRDRGVGAKKRVCIATPDIPGQPHINPLSYQYVSAVTNTLVQ